MEESPRPYGELQRVHPGVITTLFPLIKGFTKLLKDGTLRIQTTSRYPQTTTVVIRNKDRKGKDENKRFLLTRLRVFLRVYYNLRIHLKSLKKHQRG